MGTIDTIRFRDQSIRIGQSKLYGMDNLPFRVWFKVIVAMVIVKLQKRRTRIHLSRLDEMALRDIGLTKEQADREIRRSLPLYERRMDG